MMLASMPTTTQTALEATLAVWRVADYVMIALTVFIALLAFLTWLSNRKITRLTEEVRNYGGETLKAAGENLTVATQSLAVARGSLEFFARPAVTIAKLDQRPRVPLGARTRLAVCNESAQSIVIPGRDAVSMTIVREESDPASELIVVVFASVLFSVDDGQRPNDWPITLERRARFEIAFHHKLPGRIPDQDQVGVTIEVRVHYLYRDTRYTATERFPYRLQIRGGGVHV